MIDNIKFNFTFKPDENWLTKLQENIKLKKEWESKKGKAFRGILFLDNKNSDVGNSDVGNSDDENLDDGNLDKKNKKKFNLKIPVLRIGILLTDSGAKVEIENSLRKWFFKGVINKEFDKQTFNECLVLLSEKLFISKELLMDAKVTKLEYGASMNFSPAFRCFTTCIHEHTKYEKKCVYGNETVEFKGEYKSIIFYDKITEERDREEKFSAKNQKELNKRGICLRYEVKIKKVSGVPDAKGNMSYIKDIITNWNLIVDLWVNELDNIIFMNDMNPKVYLDLKDSKIKSINQYLIYLGMEKLGLNDWQLLLKERVNIKIRKGLMDSHRKIHTDFKSKLEDKLAEFSYLFKMKVNDKAKQLKQ